MRKFLERHLPKPRELREKYYLHLFGRIFLSPSLWKPQRHLVARGAALGVACAFIPLPIQTAGAIAACLIVRANLPMAAIATLVSNPLTYVPLYYSAYRLGNFIIGGEPAEKGDFSLDGLGGMLEQVGEPLLLGCLILGALSSALAYFAVCGLWHEGRREKGTGN